MTAPLVSVLIDTYNHERYIEQAIVSVLEQGLSAAELEVVVVDDGSTDNTAAIVEKFVPRVRLLRKKNGGQASAFNAGIPELCVPIVAFLDGDDWWASGKLRAALDTLQQNPEVAAVGHGFFEVRDGRPTASVVPSRTCKLDLSTIEAALLADAGRIFLGSSMMTVRRRVLEQVGRIPEELRFCADMPILTLALALGGAIVLDQPLLYYRMHSENLFAVGHSDPGKVRRRFENIGLHLRILPPRLAELGVPEEVIKAHFQGNWIDVERFQLRTEGGSRRRTFRVEMRHFHSAYRNPSLGYILFKYFVAGMTLLLPPRRFYQVRDWYSRRHLKKVRELLGQAEVVDPYTIIRRRQIEPGQMECTAGSPCRTVGDGADNQSDTPGPTDAGLPTSQFRARG